MEFTFWDEAAPWPPVREPDDACFTTGVIVGTFDFGFSRDLEELLQEIVHNRLNCDLRFTLNERARWEDDGGAVLPG